MKLILFRHGLAMDRDEAIASKVQDALRPLVPKGREKTKEMARALIDWKVQADLIVSSPFVRAMQTAEVVSHTFKNVEIIESVELVPSSPPTAFAQWLKSNAKMATTVIAIGHEPHLTMFASWCLTGSKNSFIDLKKSGVICLEIESFEDLGPQSAMLKAIIQPKHIS